MQHFSDFGVIKQTNKKLKKLEEMKSTYKGRKLGEISDPSWSGTPAESVVRGNIDATRNKRKDSPFNAKTRDDLKYPYKKRMDISSEYRLDAPEWSDIRKVKDDAASQSGYLGFRKDPFKGFGGMMEEAIPHNEIEKRLFTTKKLLGGFETEATPKGKRISRDFFGQNP
jgi:hypothetical protein